MKAFQRYLGKAGEEYQKGRYLNETCWRYLNEVRRESLQLHIKPEAIVLEFGVGTGWNLSGLQCAERMGYDVIMVIPEWVKDVKFINELSVIEDHSIDDVICFHVLEHVSNPIEILSQIAKMLKPGGRLHLRLPYEFRRRDRWPSPESDRDYHVYAWTPKTIFNLLSSVGFQNIRIGLKRFGGDRISAITAQKLKTGLAGFKLIRKSLQIISRGYEITIIANL